MLEAVEPVFHAYVVAPAAEIVVELPLHIVNEGAAETVKVGIGFTVMITSSKEEVHGALEIVHLSVADEPTTNPVTPEVGEDVVVTVAVPEITDHNPVPEAGEFPANVVVVTLQRFWSAPAFAAVGGEVTVTVIVLEPEHPAAVPVTV